MQLRTLWSDGGVHPAAATVPDDGLGAVVATSRGGTLAMAGPQASAWLVLRGSAVLDCREGRFELSCGQWIVLGRESRPRLRAAADGHVLGLVLAAWMQAMAVLEGGLLPGLGQLAPGARARALRLWRGCAGAARDGRAPCGMERQRIEPLLRLLAAQQAQLRAGVDRCPGRSQRRRRQVLERMQRAWLHMAANLDRPLRVADLAALAGVSVWHFTRTFRAIHGEGPQAAAGRLRLAHAARLLRGRRLSVGEAGAACGFRNACSFSRAFRARFGVPPSRYRHAAGASGPAAGVLPGRSPGRHRRPAPPPG